MKHCLVGTILQHQLFKFILPISNCNVGDIVVDGWIFTGDYQKGRGTEASFKNASATIMKQTGCPNAGGRQFLRSNDDIIGTFNFYCPTRNFCGTVSVKYSEVRWTSNGQLIGTIYVRVPKACCK